MSNASDSALTYAPPPAAVQHGLAEAPMVPFAGAQPVVDRGRLSAVPHGPDPAVKDLLDPMFCLENSVLPWRHEGGRLMLAYSDAERFARIANGLRSHLGPIDPIPMQADLLQGHISRIYAKPLLRRAETWVPRLESCRDFGTRSRLGGVLAAVAAGLTIASLALAPDIFLIAIVTLALATMLMAQILKAAALVAGHTAKPATVTPSPTRAPRVSLLVPLLDERDIAGTLVKRLDALTYPKSRLEALLILEADDARTRAALADTDLPDWMRVIEVPAGDVTTKPRALNYAFPFTSGEIIGIYDAEDAPAPDQIDEVVARFETARPEVACLQGILDFYNPKANWISRCFTVEYATWFRVLLPGLVRLGFAIPLGGTTVFFRRGALEHVRGWDAHNVTEDADLGVRLARYGYRTQVIPTVTREEANARLWPWIRQRSRWLKGYMLTYLVHMRAPLRLLSQLGPWRFLGVQLIFLTAILQFILAPALWSFWAITAGLGHPFHSWAGSSWVTTTVLLFLGAELISMLAAYAAVMRTPHRGLMLWVPTMMLYFPLGVIAAYKALWECISRPFFWDKTQHGQGPSAAAPTPEAEPLTFRSRRPVSDG